MPGAGRVGSGEEGRSLTDPRSPARPLVARCTTCGRGVASWEAETLQSWLDGFRERQAAISALDSRTEQLLASQRECRTDETD